MNKKLVLTLFVLCVLISADGKKSSRSRSSSSGRGSSKKTNSNPQPAPTSLSYPQSNAAKPSLFAWQEKPAQKSASTWQSKTQSGQGHSYPSSQTGLSGSKSKPPQTNQESVQRSNAPQSRPETPTQGNSQSGHAYPSSNGLSGNTGTGYPQGSGLSGAGAAKPASPGAGYPQGGGLSGSGTHVANPGANYPHGSGAHSSAAGYPNNAGSQGAGYSGGAPPPYPGNNGNSPQYHGNNYQHQPPPPPYPNQGSNYGGYGGYGGHGGYGGPGGHGGYGGPGGQYNPGPQKPGYFGNVANYGQGYGGVSRTSSALKGVGMAGVGVGTLLTGLALWNLARSTGNNRHTVIYDNRGQPVAVAPGNDTVPSDSFLKDLVNCSLTISTDNATEVLAIPCAIASSFSPDADVKDVGGADGKLDNTKCIVSVLTNKGKEYTTTIPCATLLNTAAENNVTEPPLIVNGTDNVNDTINFNGTDNISATINSDTTENMPYSNQPAALGLSSSNLELTPTNSSPNCTSEPGEIRDPINPCFAVTSDLTVIPVDTTDVPK